MFWGFLMGLPVGAVLGIAFFAFLTAASDEPRSGRDDTDDRR